MASLLTPESRFAEVCVNVWRWLPLKHFFLRIEKEKKKRVVVEEPILHLSVTKVWKIQF